jgi:octaprenyl-diphosphate synthase
MKYAAGQPLQATQTLRDLYAPVQQELHQVEEILARELSSEHAFVDRLVKYGVRLGGKRLRPALLLLSARVAGPVQNDHLVLAAAVEMIHTATLIHDDVLDEATLRRHLDTVNSRWNNETSVLLGDYLVTRAICLASSVEGTFACQTIGHATRTMCEGELRQVAGRGNYDLPEQDYLDIIADKTAALIACCCRLGAHYAGASPDLEDALAQYGLQLGIAFQIADDLLDVLGDEATVGKSLGTDLAKQKSTLPLIHVLQQADPTQRSEVVQLLSRSGNHRRDALRPWLERFDAVAYARQKADGYSRLAREGLAAAPAGPARDAMLELTRFVVARQH